MEAMTTRRVLLLALAGAVLTSAAIRVVAYSRRPAADRAQCADATMCPSGLPHTMSAQSYLERLCDLAWVLPASDLDLFVKEISHWDDIAR